jgi:aspartate carbamoyltransferase catalytic subunit
MHHILSADEFTRDHLMAIFTLTDELRRQAKANRQELAGRHRGSIVATLFYEPSTRTRLSFESAAQRLGMGIISTENARESSSNTKGESLEDTIRTVASYADVIVLRHSDDDSAKRAASVSKVPIINAGAGKGEHPTQALLDLYTISRAKGKTDNLHLVIGGDLKHGRTARSLAKLIALYPHNHITFVSTPELGIDNDIKVYLASHGTTYTEVSELPPALAEADAVYWTRLQKERLEDPRLESLFSIGQGELALMAKDAIIMHPLPRNNEIDPTVDADPRAKYFEQVENGLYIRMALLDMAVHP